MENSSIWMVRNWTLLRHVWYTDNTQGGFEMDWGDLFQWIFWVFVGLIALVALLAFAGSVYMMTHDPSEAPFRYGRGK